MPLYVKKLIEKRKKLKEARLDSLGVRHKEYFSPKCRWISEEDLCDYLQISKETLGEYREVERMPFLRMKFNGRSGKPYYRYRYDLNDIEKWLQRRCETHNDLYASTEYENLMNKEVNEAEEGKVQKLSSNENDGEVQKEKPIKK